MSSLRYWPTTFDAMNVLYIDLALSNSHTLYICASEIFTVKTTSLSKVLLLFFAFFAYRAPTCQQDVITLQLKLCLTVFFP